MTAICSRVASAFILTAPFAWLAASGDICWDVRGATAPRRITSRSRPAHLLGPNFCSGYPTSGHELQQCAVDLLGVGPGDGMRAAGDDHRLHVPDQAGKPFACLGVGQDLVVVAMDD
jgi:hypothetical protein